MNGIKANPGTRIKKDVDLFLRKMKLKNLGQPHDEVFLTADRRYKHQKANEGRIILKDGLLFRKD